MVLVRLGLLATFDLSHELVETLIDVYAKLCRCLKERATELLSCEHLSLTIWHFPLVTHIRLVRIGREEAEKGGRERERRTKEGRMRKGREGGKEDNVTMNDRLLQW